MEVNLDAIAANARTLVRHCRARGLQVIGVTKGAAGDPKVAAAMVAGGVAGLADSRVDNLARLREHNFPVPHILIRTPMLSITDDVVSHADISLNTETSALQALSGAAVRRQHRHDIVLMVEIGDLREGILPANVPQAAQLVQQLPGLRLVGVGANVGCYGGVIPSREQLDTLADCAAAAAAVTGGPLAVVSGGASNVLPLAGQRELPLAVNELRIGEAILLGTSGGVPVPWPELRRDTFRLVAEVIEVKEKPSVPEGEIGTDAFGREPEFVDRGIRRRALIAAGEQDIRSEGLSPLRPGVIMLGASSDHLLLDVEDAGFPVRVGDEVAFAVDYGALVTAMVSPYVQTVYVEGVGRY